MTGLARRFVANANRDAAPALPGWPAGPLPRAERRRALPVIRLRPYGLRRTSPRQRNARAWSAERRHRLVPCLSAGRAPCDQRASPLGAPLVAFLSPGPCFRVPDRGLWPPSSGKLSLSLRQHRVQPLKADPRSRAGRVTRGLPKAGVRSSPPAGAASHPAVTTPHESALEWMGWRRRYIILGIKSRWFQMVLILKKYRKSVYWYCSSA